MEKHSEEVTTGKPEKGNRLRLFFLNLGKLILDATKLSFGSLVLGTIIKGDIPQSALLISGIKGINTAGQSPAPGAVQ